MFKIMLMLLFFIGCLAANESEPEQIILTTIDDQNITLTSTNKGIDFGVYRGKIIVLDFLHTLCGPCRIGLREMTALQEKYPQDLRIITLVMDKNRSNQYVREFMEEYDANTTFTNSPANHILGKALGGIDMFPTVIIFDQEGEYVNDYRGKISNQTLEEDIEMALED